LVPPPSGGIERHRTASNEIERHRLKGNETAIQRVADTATELAKTTGLLDGEQKLYAIPSWNRSTASASKLAVSPFAVLPSPSCPSLDAARSRSMPLDAAG